MFAGVFVPTLLTILGVILYLREGWVVGEAGLFGAWAVMGASLAISLTTAFSLAAAFSNSPPVAGGAYALISRSLGLEVGGSVGLPLYVSQVLVVPMYVFGFREGWLTLFPTHSAWAVDASVFAVITGIAAVSAGFSFRVQYIVLAVVLASLVSIAGGLLSVPAAESALWRRPDPGWGTVFAVFFPAVTGVLAGANMSGELEDPRRAIPRGTLAAVVLSGLVYLGLALLMARVDSNELRSNYTVLLDNALWAPAVLAGLLGATFSSALASMVGAPRILQALAADGLPPGSSWFARRDGRGEPRNALWFSAGIAGVALLFRDLNAIAPFITMVFLVAYGVINAVVALETLLGLASFRPAIRLPAAVPLLGAAACLVAMVVIHPVVAAGAVVLVLIAFWWLERRRLYLEHGDLRSGLLMGLAVWAARHADVLPGAEARSWVPRLLLPLRRPTELEPVLELAIDIARPGGSLDVLAFEAAPGPWERTLASARMRMRGSVRWGASRIDGPIDVGLTPAIQALGTTVFEPNMLVLPLPSEADQEPARVALRHPTAHHLAVLLHHDLHLMGKQGAIAVWLREPELDWDPDAAAEHSNLDLALMLAWRLHRARGWPIRLIVIDEPPFWRARNEAFLHEIAERARMPRADCVVIESTFEAALDRPPTAALHLFGVADPPDLDAARGIARRLDAPCVFVQRAGPVSAFA